MPILIRYQYRNKNTYPYASVPYVIEPVVVVVAGNSDDVDSSGELVVHMTGSGAHNPQVVEAHMQQKHPGEDNAYYMLQRTADTVFGGHYLKQNIELSIYL